MMRRLLATLSLCLIIAPAHAEPCGNNGRWCAEPAAKVQKARVSVPSSDPRPGRWCAWWLRRELGIPRSAFRPYEWNLARAFRYIGKPAAGPAVGVIVVWRHHVGVITGRNDRGWIVRSGNDGGRVRERARSIKGAIAFRWPPGYPMWPTRAVAGL